LDSNTTNLEPAGSPSSEALPRRGLFVVPKPVRSGDGRLKVFTADGQVYIQSEFTDQLEALTSAYMAEFKPSNVTETLLVRDLASARCRCEYVSRLKTNPGIASSEKMVATLLRYQAANERTYKRSLKALKAILRERERQALRRPHLVMKAATTKTTGEC
jgi:hypothetical protein